MNDNAPVGNDDAIVVDEGGTATALVGGASSVLANDIDTDLPNDTLTVDATPVSGPSSRYVDVKQDGTLQLYPRRVGELHRQLHL